MHGDELPGYRTAETLRLSPFVRPGPRRRAVAARSEEPRPCYVVSSFHSRYLRDSDIGMLAPHLSTAFWRGEGWGRYLNAPTDPTA